ASLRLHLPPQLRRALETGWRTQSDQRNETFNFVLRAMAERSLCGDQTSTCRNNPAVAPENNRINCAKPRDGVAAGNLPDPIASLRFALVAEIPRRPLRFGWKLDGQNRYWEPKKRVSGQRGKRSELLQQSEGSSSQSMQGPQ